VEGGIFRQGKGRPKVVHEQVLSVFKPFLGAAVVFENEGGSGCSEVLHNCLLMSDLLIIGLILVDLHSNHLREVDDRFFSGNLKVISPSFLLWLISGSQLRQF
jgi:hypothetical protein